MLTESDINTILNEIEISTARSSGPGGQNVNKVESKVIVKYNLNNTKIFDEDTIVRLSAKLKSKLTDEGILIVTSQLTRSQQKNKEVAIEKLFALLEKALIPPKLRKKTKPSVQAREKRLKEKSIKSVVKANRGKIKSDE